MLNLTNFVKFIVTLALFIFLTTTFSSSAIKNASYNCEQTSVINYNYKDYKKVTFLNIEVDNKKKWYENSIGAILSKSNNGEAIDTKYKKRFKAKIIVHFGKNKICNFRGSIRLHGDYKDHLKFESGKLVSSLDVTIKNGHINSIRKFKLYLPESRKGINEVLITQLFKELKILSPNTFFLNTNVNNQKSLYLFQEKISKEMLEKNARREGPIFETIDENKKSNFIFTRLHLAKLVNKEWLTKGFNNFFYTFKNFNRINRALLSSNKKFNRKFYIEHEYLNQNLDKFRVFEPILYSLGYPHGLSKNNRYFYLNIVSGEFEPIYYDGDIAKIKNFKYDKKNFDSKIVTPFIFENSIYALNQLKKINSKKFYKKI